MSLPQPFQKSEGPWSLALDGQLLAAWTGPVPYLQVTLMPLLTLPRPRQRAKNIYDLLPRRQEELGRHQSRSIRVFSTESLLSRNSDSLSPEHVPSHVGSAAQVYRTHICAAGYTVGVYDNASVPQVCGDLTPSAHYVNVRASRDCSSISSEDSRDYVNVPRAEEVAENSATTNSSPGNPFVLPRTQELEFAEERDEGCGNACDCTSFWSPRTEGNNQLSDGEGSSQLSNDYVNMSELDLRDFQEKQPWVAFQDYRDYENVPSADPNGSQHQKEEEVTFSSTDHVPGRTDGPGTHVQPVMQSGRVLGIGDYMAFQPSAQNGDRQMKHGEGMSNEDSNDYENVPAAKLGGRDSEEGTGTQLLPDELRPSHPAGKPHGVVYPAGSITTTVSSEHP
ncbi:lymphocyte transmembrane adapter 1 isoform X2 [Choloepus didactylus]|uniref:lymphocyte transmembrane adapter 1 isoform X2 n=1 Tax=Choloepus didactylus TaxID=27675 RepID=UPI00189D1BAC|nr:lymphocyte transmembrane adapter 1 isoform X2 [Choloepus didactylus]